MNGDWETGQSGSPSAARPGVSIEWDELPGYRGHTIRLWTVHNPPRTVELLEAGDDALRVSTRLSGSTVEYSVQRAGFLRARLVR